MSKLLPAIAATALVAAVAASPASAWTSPTTLSTADEANPLAQAAFDGSVMLGWLEPQASLSKRLGPPAPITTADPFEKVWDGGLDRDGNAIVITVRRHKPVQRIRAIIGGARRTISDNTHSATQPTLDVAPDGTAVAGWAWHDPAGLARAGRDPPARPGALRQAADGLPTRPGKQRPFVRVAAGEGGRAVLTWQVQTGADAPLHVLTAGENSTFGADQVLAGGGRWADVALAVGAGGAVQRRLPGPDDRPDRACASPRAPPGAPLGEPAVLATGGKGTSLRHPGRDRVLRRRHRHRRLGQARQLLRGRRHARGLHARARRGGVRRGADARRGRPTGSCSRAAPVPPPRWPG